MICDSSIFDAGGGGGEKSSHVGYSRYRFDGHPFRQLTLTAVKAPQLTLCLSRGESGLGQFEPFESEERGLEILHPIVDVL